MDSHFSSLAQRSTGHRKAYGREYVEGLFDAIAPRYDLLNHVLSLGIDILWRRRVARELRPLHPARILDLATGTGDLALALTPLRPERIIGLDPSQRMLSIAREKVVRRKLQNLITLQRGSAEHLRFPDASFDAVTVGFGVRNFSDLFGGLGEIRRVLRPGGVAAILEFSHPTAPLFRLLYDAYSRFIIPASGRAISGHAEAYHYLPATVSEFPSAQEFGAIMTSAGFRDVRWHAQTFGIATITLGTK